MTDGTGECVESSISWERPRDYGYEKLLVVGSINGFGSPGPYVDRPAFDFIAQAMSGLMATNGVPGECRCFQ